MSWAECLESGNWTYLSSFQQSKCLTEQVFASGAPFLVVFAARKPGHFWCPDFKPRPMNLHAGEVTSFCFFSVEVKGAAPALPFLKKARSFGDGYVVPFNYQDSILGTSCLTHSHVGVAQKQGSKMEPW